MNNMKENPFILGNQPTEGYATKGAGTSGMTDGGKFVGTASVCSKHELASCEECREKDTWTFPKQQSHEVIALFGYPIDNSVRAKMFDDYEEVKIEAEKWKDISYFICAWKVPYGTATTNLTR